MIIRYMREVEFNNRNQQRFIFVRFAARDILHLDELLCSYFNDKITETPDKSIILVDETPDDFRDAGGFDIDIVDFKDEQGNNTNDLYTLRWWMRALTPHKAGLYKGKFDKLRTRMEALEPKQPEPQEEQCSS